MTKPTERLFDCPSPATLSAWLDDELDGAEALRHHNHLRECAACREQVLGWIEAVPDLPADAAAAPAISTCLDEETLAAYCDTELGGAMLAHVERHLLECAQCVSEVQRLIALRVAVEEGEERSAVAETESTRPSVDATEWLARLRGQVAAMGSRLMRPWPMLGAAAAMAMLAIVIVRVLPSGDGTSEVLFRGVPEPPRFEVAADAVAARAHPGDDQAIVVTLQRGAVVKRLDQSGDWTRIELADGRRVWVRSAQVAQRGRGGENPR